MSDGYMVTRCICDDISFKELKQLSYEKGYKNVHQLIEGKICATNCKLCVPYIHKMLKTGQIAFEEIEDRSGVY